MYNDDDFRDEEEVSSSNGNLLLDFYNANKKLVWILIGVIAFVLILSLVSGGCSNNSGETPSTPITMQITDQSKNLSLDNTYKLIASVPGVPTAAQSLSWTSSDPGVATVDNTGLVRGVDYGTATITASYTHTDGETYSASCVVTVSQGDPNTTINKVEFQEGEIMISSGDEYILPVVFTPSNGYLTDIEYSVDDTSVVSVDNTGKIKALRQGQTKVRFTANNNQFTDEIVVNVLTEKITPQVIINPTSIEFLEKLVKMEVGEISNLEYSFAPENAMISNLIWNSSNQDVVTINNGVATALKVGSAEITVRSLTGKSSIMTIEVIDATVPVESISVIGIENNTLSLSPGSTHAITANIIPADATNKNVTYSSSDPSVASVDSLGSVIAHRTGSATITLTTVDGNKTASFTVVVSDNSSGGSQGGSSSGGSSSGGGSSSTDSKDVSLKSNNGSIYSTYTKAVEGGKKDAPTIVTVIYGTNVTDVKWCTNKYGESECDPTKGTSVADGKTFEINADGVTVINYVSYIGSEISTKYTRYVYLNGTTGNDACYKESGSGGSYVWGDYSGQSGYTLDTTATKREDCLAKNNPQVDDSKISAKWTFKDRYFVLGRGDVNEGDIAITNYSSKKITNVYYSIGSTPNTSSATTAYSNSWCGGGGYTGYQGNSHVINYSSPKTSATVHFCAWTDQIVSVIVKYEDGTTSNTATVTITEEE